MSRLSLAGTARSRRSRRTIALLVLVVLCALLLMSAATAALAADGTTVDNTTSNPNIKTSAGLEAPQLDYTFVLWSFILTFGLLVVYYLVILRISESEFKKIIDAHFGPKQDGR
jgi:hypothetical protein